MIGLKGTFPKERITSIKKAFVRTAKGLADAYNI